MSNHDQHAAQGMRLCMTDHAAVTYLIAAAGNDDDIVGLRNRDCGANRDEAVFNHVPPGGPLELEKPVSCELQTECDCVTDPKILALHVYACSSLLQSIFARPTITAAYI